MSGSCNFCFHRSAAVFGLIAWLALSSLAGSQCSRAQDAAAGDSLQQLQAKVAALETEVARLRAERANDELLRQLRGRWSEVSRLESGKVEREADGAEWLLENEVDSDRLVLSAEVTQEVWGRLRVDATKNPAWIDFEHQWNGKTSVLRGLVKYEYKRATIALPRRKFDGQGFDSPQRPTSFDSTADNGVTVYSLGRPDILKYGR
jgi:uncharacterized protein (TIGR03067 family)